MARWRRHDISIATPSGNHNRTSTQCGQGGDAEPNVEGAAVLWGSAAQISTSTWGNGESGHEYSWGCSPAWVHMPQNGSFYSAPAHVWPVSDEPSIMNGWSRSEPSITGSTTGEAYVARNFGKARGRGRGRGKRQGPGRPSALGQPAAAALRPGVWQIIYWPCWDKDDSISAGAGRAEYIRLLFEETGTVYEEIEDAEFVRDFFWRRVAELQPSPVFAPPALHKDGFVLAQTPSIVRYLARALGLLPKGAEAEAKADQILETITDFIAEGRIAFHPDYLHKKSYWVQQDVAAPYIRAFERGRLPRFIAHFERLVAHGKRNGGHLLGSEFCYIDLQLFAVMRVCEAQFPDAFAQSQMPELRAFIECIAARPRIASYLSSPRCRPFAGESMM